MTDSWQKAPPNIRKFVYHSDVVWLKGLIVTNKYIDENGEPCIDIETTTINQRNEEVMPGRNSDFAVPEKVPSRWTNAFP